MKLRSFAAAGALVASLYSVPFAAGGDGGMMMGAPTLTETEETMFSIGLRFSFSDMAPEVVGAVRDTTTDTDGDVTGIQGEIAIPLSGEHQGKAKVRVLGLVGDRDALGQAGVGFNFGSGQMMALILILVSTCLNVRKDQLQLSQLS